MLGQANSNRQPKKTKPMASKVFDKLGMRRPKSSAFDLSREQKLSFKMGTLIPTYLEEIIPGDQFSVRTESLIRLAPMLAPVMHRVNVFLHYFFVPNRIIWDEWEHFITGVSTTTDDTPPVYPVIRTAGSTDQATIGSLEDYLGIPTNVTNHSQRVSQLPFRAYQLIWEQYYADQNLNPKIDLTALPSDITGASPLRNLRQRAWEKDYFTSALPFAQRGEAAGVNADVTYRDISNILTNTGNPSVTAPLGAFGNPSQLVDDTNTAEKFRLENIDDIGIDINELRKSSAIQRWLEKSARGGGRYIETLLAHFGVKSEDARLQRPEYLGGGKQPIRISEVLNTTGTTNAPQGDMTGHGISAGVTNSFKKYFTEHGYVMGIMSVMPLPAYMQGIDRHWTRRDRFDYYWPEFANLGEQEILNKEIFWAQAEPSVNATFGYQQRYAEYKYGKSSVHGLFRTELDFWHLARKFATAPALNADFIAMKSAEIDRVFAVDDEDHIIAQLYHSVKARRPMPFFSDPRLT